MIVTCGQCQAKFKVDPGRIKATGSKVRCGNCQHVFVVYPPQEEAGPAAGDGLDALFGDGDNYPPLRRPAAAPDDSQAMFLDGDDDALPPPLDDDLGLSADPAKGGGPVRDVSPMAEAREEAPRQAPRRRERASAGAGSRLFLGLAIAATLLVAAIYFMANRPEPLALSEGEEAPAAPAAESAPGDAPADAAGREGITFAKTNQNHYFRNNEKAGQILIITGLVRNGYAQRRSFIQLRGRLVSADGATLADRYGYAGNLIAEEDLVTLPIGEIFSRLSIKGGQNGQNMNVEPGQEVPFMLVFDKLPEGMAEYRIDPMGSSPAD